MKTIIVGYDLSEAWETWEIDVPDDLDETDLDAIEAHVAENGLDGLVDAGNSGMTITSVNSTTFAIDVGGWSADTELIVADKALPDLLRVISVGLVYADVSASGRLEIETLLLEQIDEWVRVHGSHPWKADD